MSSHRDSGLQSSPLVPYHHSQHRPMILQRWMAPFPSGLPHALPDASPPSTPSSTGSSCCSSGSVPHCPATTDPIHHPWLATALPQLEQLEQHSGLPLLILAVLLALDCHHPQPHLLRLVLPNEQRCSFRLPSKSCLSPSQSLSQALQSISDQLLLAQTPSSSHLPPNAPRPLLTLDFSSSSIHSPSPSAYADLQYSGGDLLLTAPSFARPLSLCLLDSASSSTQNHHHAYQWFFDHLSVIINSLHHQSCSPSSLISSLSPLSALERARLVELSSNFANPVGRRLGAGTDQRCLLAHFHSAQSLPQLILSSCNLFGDHPAVFWSDHNRPFGLPSTLSISFSQLRQQAHQIAAVLSRILIKPTGPSKHSHQPIVGLLLDKNPWLPIILLAVNLSGAAYLNLDLSLPAERIRELISQSQLSLLAFFDDPHQAQRFEFQVPCINLFEVCTGFVKPTATSRHEPVDVHQSQPIPSNLSSDLAYLVSTSGSTGKPKLIPITHFNVVSFLSNYKFRFGRQPRKTRVLQFPSYAFDVSVMNIWDTLAHGATLCITSTQSLKSDLMGSMIELGCDAVDLTPSVAGLLLDHPLFTHTSSTTVDETRSIWEKAGLKLRHLNTGAESVPLELRRAFLTRGVSVCVDYGPSETTVGVISSMAFPGTSHQQLVEGDIGRPTGSNQVFLLDPNSDDFVPLGATGEICIAGGQVSRGYVDPLLSVDKFVDLTLDGGLAGPVPIRVYRTGDLARYLPNGSEGYGSIRYIGRADQQVKIAGVRIELGEIEEKCNRAIRGKARQNPVNHHPARIIVDCCQDRLVGFIEFNQDSVRSPVGQTKVIERIQSLDQAWLERFTEEIITTIESELPKNMVPREFIPLKSIPISYTGKTDRKALREFYQTSVIQSRSISLRSVENKRESRAEKIASLAWRIGLQTEMTFEADHDFMKLGGDSLRLMKTIGVIRREAIQVNYSQLIKTCRSFSKFVKELEQSHSDDAGAEVMKRNTNYERYELVTKNEKESIYQTCEEEHQLQRDQIEDVLPTIPIQTGMIQEGEGLYYSQAVYDIDERFDSDQLSQKFKQMFRKYETFRTVIVRSGEAKMFQVVLKAQNFEPKLEIVQVSDETDLEDTIQHYLRKDRDENCKFEFGKIMNSIQIFECKTKQRMVWSIHHCLSDGWTLEVLMKSLSITRETESKVQTGYGQLVKAWTAVDEEFKKKSQDYWINYLKGYQDGKVRQMISASCAKETRWSKGQDRLERFKRTTGVTPAIVLQLGIAIGLYNSNVIGSDAAFGMVRSGRDSEIGIEDIIGCCVSVLPTRIRLKENKKQRIEEILERLSEEDRLAREHQLISLGDIGRLTVGRGDFLEILVTVQSWEKDKKLSVQPIRQPPLEIFMPTRYKLSIEVTMEEDLETLEIKAFYDDRVISGVDKILQQIVLGLAGIVEAGHEGNLSGLLIEQAEDERSSFPVIVLDPIEVDNDKLTKMISIWSQVLRINPEKIDIEKSFEKNGGDSLGMMRVMNLIKFEFQDALNVQAICLMMRQGKSLKQTCF